MRARIRDVFAVALFSVMVPAAGQDASIAIPLYAPDTSACRCFPNIPLLPVVPFVGGILLSLWLERTTSWRSHLARAALLGGGVTLYRGLLQSTAFAVHETYISGPYRAYALAYLAGISALAAWWSAGALSRERTPWPLRGLYAAGSGAAVLGAAALFAAGETIVGIVAVAGILGGVGASRTRLDERLPRPAGWVAIASLVAVAFATRALFGLATLARTGPGGAFAIASDDGDTYYQLATGLLSGTTSLNEVLANTYFPPGYAIFTAAVLGLSRGSFAVLILVQAAFAAGAALCLYLFARDLVGPAAAWLAAALFAMDANLIQNESTLTAEAILIPLLLLGVWALSRYRHTGRSYLVVAAGAAIAYAFVTRNLAFLLVPPVCVWLLRDPGADTRRTIRDVALIIGLVLASSVPTLVATGARGDPRLTNQGSAIAWEQKGDDVIDNTFLLERGIHPFKDPIGSLRAAIADPLPVLGFLLSAVPDRIMTLLFAPAPGVFDPLVIVNGAYGSRYAGSVELIRSVALVVGAAVLVRQRMTRYRDPVLAVGFVLLYVAVFAFFFPPFHAFRYRIPIEPFLLLMQAAGLVAIVRSLGVRVQYPRPAPNMPSTARSLP